MNRLWLCGLTAAVVGSLAIQAQAWWGRDDRGRDWDRDDHRHGGYSPHYVPYGREYRSINHDSIRLFVGGMELYFWEGMYYRRYADRYVVVQPPVGAVVTTIPPEAQITVVDGVPYYNVNGVTYVSSGLGYQVVPPPRVVVATPVVAAQPVTVIQPPAVVLPPAQPVQSAAVPVQAPPGPAQSSVTAAQTPGSDDVFTINVPNSKGDYTGVTIKRSGNGFVGPQGEFYPEFPKVDQLKLMYAK